MPKITKLCFWFKNFGAKISAKSASKMLMKLTPHELFTIIVRIFTIEKIIYNKA
jgi:hypothetical protein